MSPAWVEIPPWEPDGRPIPGPGEMGPGLRLVLIYPPSANQYWRSAPGKGMVPSHQATRYKRDVALQLAGCRPLLGDVVIGECRIYRPRRVGDLVNRLKVLEDALQGFAYLDDAQICAYRNLERLDDPERPRVEMELHGERFATAGEVSAWRAKRAGYRVAR